MSDDQKKIIEKYREEEQKNDEKEKENLRCRKKDEKTSETSSQETRHICIRSFIVEALDNGGFDIWIARYSKTNIVFFKKFFHWLRDKFFALVRL